MNEGETIHKANAPTGVTEDEFHRIMEDENELGLWLLQHVEAKKPMHPYHDWTPKLIAEGRAKIAEKNK